MLFKFRNFVIRCFEMEDGIWFSGNDVAEVLGYQNGYDAIRVHTSNSDRKALSLKASRESREANECSVLWSGNDFSDKTLINESGLYCMIFGSKLESAEEFKLWVTGTVLPSIRKHGGYVMDQELLTDAQQEKLMKKVEKLSARVESLRAKNAKLEAKNAKLSSENAKAKKEITSLNEYATMGEELNDKLFAEIETLKRKLKPVPEQKFAAPKSDKTFKVDSKTGFVVLDI